MASNKLLFIAAAGFGGLVVLSNFKKNINNKIKKSIPRACIHVQTLEQWNKNSKIGGYVFPAVIISYPDDFDKTKISDICNGSGRKYTIIAYRTSDMISWSGDPDLKSGVTILESKKKGTLIPWDVFINQSASI